MHHIQIDYSKMFAVNSLCKGDFWSKMSCLLSMQSKAIHHQETKVFVELLCSNRLAPKEDKLYSIYLRIR